MLSISSVPPELTPERLQLLYGDLALDLEDIIAFTHATRASIQKMLKEQRIRKGYPVRSPWQDQEQARLAELLGLHVKLSNYSRVEQHAQLREAFLAKARTTGLDWAALDQFNEELPALQAEVETRLRKIEDEYYLPQPVLLKLMVKRPREKTYLARRSASGKKPTLITGNLVRSESIGDAARRILRTEAGLEATFTDVLGVRTTVEETATAVHLIVVLTVTDPKAEPKKPKNQWRWVHFSKLLSPWRYPMLNYL